MSQIQLTASAARPSTLRRPEALTAPVTAPAPAAPAPARAAAASTPADQFRVETRSRQFQAGPSIAGQPGAADPRGVRRAAPEPRAPQLDVAAILSELRNMPMPPAPPARADLPEPAAMERDQKSLQQGDAAWKRVEGELFVDGPSMEDPKQGWLGDCYLVAAMGAVAG